MRPEWQKRKFQDDRPARSVDMREATRRAITGVRPLLPRTVPCTTFALCHWYPHGSCLAPCVHSKLCANARRERARSYQRTLHNDLAV